jgi:dipeptidyl aminopeptidase/acylaminoacyl peptidase
MISANLTPESSCMTRRDLRSTRASRALAVAIALTIAYALPQAQSAPKKPLGVDDYTKWRTISGQEISPDGRWVTYVLQLTNVPQAETKPVLHLRDLETNADVEVPNAIGGTFSPDSQWIAYQVDPNPGRGRGGRGSGSTPAEPPATPPVEPPATPPSQPPSTQPAGRGSTPPPPPRRVELRNLATGEVQAWENIGTFTFSPTSTHIFLKRRAAEAEGGGSGRGGGGTSPGATPGGRGIPPVGAGPRGTDTILLDLRTGRHQLLGSVGDIAFNRTGSLLAYTVDSAVKDANGLFVFETRSGRTVALDNDAKQYNRLAWNDAADALAVVKGIDVEKKREKQNVLIAFTDVPSAMGLDDIAPTPVVLDPEKIEGFPKGWVVSDRAPLEWSEDNRRVFFGIKEQADAPDTTRRTTDERQDVDVWNTVDERIQSLQMIRAAADRNFTFRQAFDVTASRFIRIADETMRDVDIGPDGKWAVGQDPRGYVHDQKRPAADFYRVDTSTGERTLMLKGHLLGSGVFGISPHGTHFLFWKDDRLHAYDLNAGKAAAIGTGAPAFTDAEYDRPGPRPSYGLAGFTKDGKAVIAQHQYDLWLVPLDGSKATNLTGGVGSKNEMRFRYLRTQPEDPTLPRAAGPRGTIDLSKPMTLSAYGQWTKKAGFYELSNGQLKELVFEDASFSTPEKAAKSDRYLFTRQTFVEFPDLRVSGPGFTDAKTITDANPQQKDFTWGRRILFDYKNKDGVRLQGILALPDDRDVLREELAEPAPLQRAVVPHRDGKFADRGAEPRLHHHAARRPFQDGQLAQRHAGSGRGRHAQSDRHGLRRPEADRHQRAQLRWGRGGVHRHAVEDVRRHRHGGGRDGPVQRLQPELGLVVPGAGRQREHRLRLLPVRPGPLGLLPLGQPREIPVRVGPCPCRQGAGPVPDHARHRGPDRRLRERPRVLQRPPLQRQEGGAPCVPERGPRPAGDGQPQGPDGPLLPVLRPLPEGRAGAEVVERRRAVPEEGRNARSPLAAPEKRGHSTFRQVVDRTGRKR